ncbi:MAG: hypothetical protein I8H75_03360 [Myxococcaceae bacterium]|nr:hypothetical protein [Myxococcaceae bacterium]MBH2006368.1 hypothetical protein [Myxococcaceae bacterium]
MHWKLFILSLFLSGVILAEEKQIPWKLDLALGIHLSHHYNQNFLGLQNGNMFHPGFQASTQVFWKEGTQEWIFEFSLMEAWVLSTPQTMFIKSNDLLQLRSAYQFAYAPWGGNYVAAKLRTSLLPGYDVETTATDYTVVYADGRPSQVMTSTGNASTGTFSFPLTQAFLPLILEQDIGFYYRFHPHFAPNSELRAGFSSRENLAKSQKILTAVGVVYGNTPVRELDTIFEIGPSFGIRLRGNLLEKKLSYEFSFDYLFSVWQTPKNALAATHGQSFDSGMDLKWTFLPWLSLDWNLKAILNPAIFDQIQFMTTLTLAFNYSLSR